MDRRIYAPSSGLETWKCRLAAPETQWVRKKSAFETAVFWESGAMQPRGLSSSLAALLDQEASLRGSELVASFPEHRVKLPGGTRASQTDVWAILRAPIGLVSVAIEGKAGESFAETVGEWRKDASGGKEKRLTFLCETLGIARPIDDAVRYQLLHRTVSALLEAERIGANAAAMIVVSFAADPRSKTDFATFGSCVGVTIATGALSRAETTPGCPLYLGWLDVAPCSDAAIAAVAF